MDQMMSNTKLAKLDTEYVNKKRRPTNQINWEAVILPIAIGLYGVSSVLDTLYRPILISLIALSLMILTVAIGISVRRAYIIYKRRSLKVAVIASLPTIGLVVAWVLKAVSLGYYLAR